MSHELAVGAGALLLGGLAVYASRRRAEVAGIRGTVCCFDALDTRQPCPADLRLEAVAADGTTTRLRIDSGADPATFAAALPAGTYTLVGNGQVVGTATSPGPPLSYSVHVMAWSNA